MGVRSAIRLYRELRQLSQAQLAKRLGLPQYRLSRYETGDALPTLAEAEEIARALGVTVLHLWSESAVCAMREADPESALSSPTPPAEGAAG